MRTAPTPLRDEDLVQVLPAGCAPVGGKLADSRFDHHRAERVLEQHAPASRQFEHHHAAGVARSIHRLPVIRARPSSSAENAAQRRPHRALTRHAASRPAGEDANVMNTDQAPTCATHIPSSGGNAGVSVARRSIAMSSTFAQAESTQVFGIGVGRNVASSSMQVRSAVSRVTRRMLCARPPACVSAGTPTSFYCALRQRPNPGQRSNTGDQAGAAAPVVNHQKEGEPMLKHICRPAASASPEAEDVKGRVQTARRSFPA